MKPPGCRRIAAYAIASCLLPILAAPPPSGADRGTQDYTGMSLEQLMEIPIYAASKREQPTREAPSSVTVVTAAEIRAFGWRNLGELLRSVRGFYTSYDRNYGFVGVRGFNRTRDYGGRLLLLLDGHRLNDPAYGTLANREEFLLDLDLIERVEVVRGPGSSLYGDNAFFGVINIVTRRAQALAGGELAVSTGSQGTSAGRLSYGHSFSGGSELVLAAGLYDSRGDEELYFPDFDDPAVGDGRARGLDDEQAGRLFARWRRGGFSLTLGHVEREKQVPTARYNSIFGDPGLVTWDRRSLVVAEFDHLTPSGWAVRARGSFDRYFYRGDYPYRGETGARVLNREEVDSQWASVDLQLSRRLSPRHLLTLGAEYRDLFSIDQVYYDEDPYQLLFASDPSFHGSGFFVQDEIQIHSKVLLHLGARLDEFDTFGSTFNPRLALILLPSSSSSLKLIYGRAFRAPNVNELYYQNGDVVQEVNPDLGPERVTSGELIWEQQLGKSVRATLAVGRITVSDLIEFSSEVNAVDEFYFVNTGEATIESYELEIEAEFGPGLMGRLAYSRSIIETEVTEGPFDNSPAHLAKLHLSAPLGSPSRHAALELLYMSERCDDLGGRLSEHWLANLNFTVRTLGDRLDLALGLYNLFDEFYQDPATGVPNRIEQDGRTFRLRATYRF